MELKSEVQTLHHCSVCNGPLETVFELPRLPLTGVYSGSYDPGFPRFDQTFNLCADCRHGQLGSAVSPEILYNSGYGFRTSLSRTASQGVRFFENYLRKLTSGKKFSTILEFGSNDGHLLHHITDMAKCLIGVDPIAEEDASHGNVTLVRGSVESTVFIDYSTDPVDLVVSEHTMEHLENPRSVLETLLEKVSEDCLFVLEFPCLDPLIEKYRFDQIFHQHTQYFSVDSVLRLIDKLGCTLVDYTFNYHYWGAIIVAFSRRMTGPNREAAHSTLVERDIIRHRYALFRREMESTALLASQLTNPVFGYGAALMLPILGYHMNTDFSYLGGVVDDDPAKHGLTYANLPVTIRSPQEIDFSNSAVLLTALDNRRPILKNLVDKNPKIILNPLAII